MAGSVRKGSDSENLYETMGPAVRMEECRNMRKALTIVAAVLASCSPRASTPTRASAQAHIDGMERLDREYSAIEEYREARAKVVPPDAPPGVRLSFMGGIALGASESAADRESFVGRVACLESSAADERCPPHVPVPAESALYSETRMKVGNALPPEVRAGAVAAFEAGYRVGRRHVILPADAIAVWIRRGCASGIPLGHREYDERLRACEEATSRRVSPSALALAPPPRGDEHAGLRLAAARGTAEYRAGLDEATAGAGSEAAEIVRESFDAGCVDGVAEASDLRAREHGELVTAGCTVTVRAIRRLRPESTISEAACERMRLPDEKLPMGRRFQERRTGIAAKLRHDASGILSRSLSSHLLGYRICWNVVIAPRERAERMRRSFRSGCQRALSAEEQRVRFADADAESLVAGCDAAIDGFLREHRDALER